MSAIPLAERMRPKTLEDIVGQEHLLGEGAVIMKAVRSGKIPSMIFWGPPGVGKTTLARVIANTLDRPFIQLSAINSGVKDIRDAIAKAQKQRFFDRPNPILFIDEIHRFSKSQQDALLGAVEDGTLTLVGATTENPSFEVIPALLSRCQVYILEYLSKDALQRLIDRALREDVDLKHMDFTFEENDALFQFSGGDARKLYNILEMAANQAGAQKVTITNAGINALIQQNIATYDKGGELHYDIASALIKSIRGSDPNGAIYWLARMLEGGEDIMFIARRLVISASEDIGLSNPNALLLAQTGADAIRLIGMPEARIILAEVVIYLATSPKSNTAYAAIQKAMHTVRTTGPLPVPLHLRNAPTKLMKKLGYGKAYQYAHDFEGNFVDQAYLPEALDGTVFYAPGSNKHEEAILRRLKSLWGARYRYED